MVYKVPLNSSDNKNKKSKSRHEWNFNKPFKVHVVGNPTSSTNHYHSFFGTMILVMSIYDILLTRNDIFNIIEIQ